MLGAVDQLIASFQVRFKGEAREDPIAAVLRALPMDPQERAFLFDAFEQRPDARFEGDVLIALAQFRRYPEKVREVRIRLGLDWRSLVDHPDVFSRKDQDVLDDLQDVLPIGSESFENWMARAVAAGLIDPGEIDFLQLIPLRSPCELRRDR